MCAEDTRVENGYQRIHEAEDLFQYLLQSFLHPKLLGWNERIKQDTNRHVYIFLCDMLSKVHSGMCFRHPYHWFYVPHCYRHTLSMLDVHIQREGHIMKSSTLKNPLSNICDNRKPYRRFSSQFSINMCELIHISIMQPWEYIQLGISYVLL